MNNYTLPVKNLILLELVILKHDSRRPKSRFYWVKLDSYGLIRYGCSTTALFSLVTARFSVSGHRRLEKPYRYTPTCFAGWNPKP